LVQILESPNIYEGFSSICWSPDGKTIAFVEAANGFASAFLISPDGGPPRILATNVEDLAYSPDGNAVAVVRSGKLSILDLSGNTLTTMRGASGLRVDALAWSPVT
jgi:Tol biopolymer transport system component